MAHSFDIVPIDFIVGVPIFFGQHENINRSLSLISSLINQDFVTIGSFFGKRKQTSLFHKVNFPMKHFFKQSDQMGNVEKGYLSVVIILDEDVNIAIRSLLAARIRSK